MITELFSEKWYLGDLYAILKVPKSKTLRCLSAKLPGSLYLGCVIDYTPTGKTVILKFYATAETFYCIKTYEANKVTVLRLSGVMLLDDELKHGKVLIDRADTLIIKFFSCVYYDVFPCKVYRL